MLLDLHNLHIHKALRSLALLEELPVPQPLDLASRLQALGLLLAAAPLVHQPRQPSVPHLRDLA